jgi:hypothetical protein
MTKPQDKDDELRQAALEYKRPPPGKVAIGATPGLEVDCEMHGDMPSTEPIGVR